MIVHTHYIYMMQSLPLNLGFKNNLNSLREFNGDLFKTYFAGA